MESRTMDFHGVALRVRPDEKHGWLMSTEDVAAGYGVTSEAIRKVKSRHSDEIKPGEHFSSVTICHAGADPLQEQRNAKLANPNKHWNKNGGKPDNLQRVATVWTKRGVLRLGMFLTSERARIFRDWCEDVVLSVVEQAPAAKADWPVPRTFSEALRLAADQAEEIERLKQDKAILEPKAEALDSLCDLQGFYTLQQVGNHASINMGRNLLFAELRRRGILQKNNQPYREHVEAGRFAVKTTRIVIGGVEQPYAQTVVTPKGLAWLHQVLGKPAQQQDLLN